MNGGPGPDAIKTGEGNNRIDVRDGYRDRVRCGPGRDTVEADQFDVAIDCEIVHRTMYPRPTRANPLSDQR